MVGSESSWALGRSQAALNARALGLFSAQGADGKPIFYGSKVAFEEDQDVPFSVVGWAVAQAAPGSSSSTRSGCIPPTPLCWQTRKGW